MPELLKGANSSLTKENPGITKYTLGVAWTTREASLEEDLQVGLVLCDQAGQAITPEALVFFNQLQEATASVTMDDDCKQVHLDLALVPQEVARLDLCLWVNQPTHSLKQVGRLHARVLRDDTGQQLLKTEEVTQGLQGEKALCLLQVYRYKGEWKVRYRGEGWNEGLQGLVKTYGVK